MILVNTYEEFTNAIQKNWQNVSEKYSSYSYGGRDYSPYTTIKGGMWMGTKDTEPTVMVNMRQAREVNKMMNFYNIMAGGVGISSSYYEFASTRIPELYDLKPMIFIVYFGLIMAW